MRLRRALCLLAATLAGSGAGAQDWATRAVCDVDEAAIFEEAFAPATLPALEEAAAAIPNPTGRFWRLVSPEGAVSHLWGTMHSANPLVLDLPDLLQSRIASARLVALEIDPILPSRAAYDAQYDRTGWYRQGRQEPLADTSINRQVLDWIRLRTQGLGWGRDAPERLTPGALAELLLSDPCNDFTYGVLPVQDSRIQTLAMIAGVEIRALENPDRIRHRLDAPGNAGFAIDFLNVYGAYLNPETTAAERATQIALYLEARIGLMMAWDSAYMAEVLGDDTILPRVNRYLLDERNQLFVDAVRPELDTGGVLIAVGSFHLPGDFGMIELLRGAGYSVTRIPLPGEAR